MARLAHQLASPSSYPEIATNRSYPEWLVCLLQGVQWLFPHRIPATRRLNLSRPDAILVVPVCNKSSQVQARHPRY